MTIHCNGSPFSRLINLLALSGLRGWQTTRSQNVEPECGDDLHWDLWGTGGHGRGLLRLLVSWA